MHSHGGGGATTTGPDVTTPLGIYQNLGGALAASVRLKGLGGQLGLAQLGEGARKATCNRRLCSHAHTSSRALSHACDVALSPTRGYW